MNKILQKLSNAREVSGKKTGYVSAGFEITNTLCNS